MEKKKTLRQRIDMVGYITAQNCNPNGDPEKGNEPRTLLNGFGIMTDVCLKRQIRNRVQLVHGTEPGYDIFIKDDSIPLERKINESIDHTLADMGMDKEELKKDPNCKDILHEAMASTYFDIRTFGGVLTSLNKNGYSDGKITGPVQVSFAQSLDIINPEELTITRVSITSEKDALEKKHEMGSKWIVPYAVYKFEVHISGPLAEKYGFTEEDLDILVDSILNMYETEHSASKTGMSVDKLFVFRHESQYGNCRFKQLQEAIKTETDFDGNHFSAEIDKKKVPKGVSIQVFE